MLEYNIELLPKDYYKSFIKEKDVIFTGIKEDNNTILHNILLLCIGRERLGIPECRPA